MRSVPDLIYISPEATAIKTNGWRQPVVYIRSAISLIPGADRQCQTAVVTDTIHAQTIGIILR